MSKMKISDWLAVHVDSHTIHDHVKLAADFQTHTGEVASWPTHTVKETRRAIATDPRGGTVSGPDDYLVAYGYEIAAHLAWKHTKQTSQKFGRGSMFRECVGFLVSAGL